MRRAHDPSGFRGRSLRFRCDPQHEAGDARGLRRQRQLAAGNEVELLRLAPNLHHDDTHRIADKRVRSRPQRMVHVASAYSDEKAGIEAELDEPVHRHHARFNLGEILPYPYDGPPARQPAGKGGHKTGRRRALPPRLRKHFVHGAQSEPALQGRIGLRMAEHRLAKRRGLAMDFEVLGFEAFNAAAQGR